MCKKVEAVCYRFYINLRVDVDEEHVFVRSSIIDNGPDILHKRRDDDEEFVQKAYFTQAKIEEMKNKLIDKIRKSKNPFYMFCAETDTFDVEEDKIFEIYEQS